MEINQDQDRPKWKSMETKGEVPWKVASWNHRSPQKHTHTQTRFSAGNVAATARK